jgi:regulator of replication initiation timing
MKPSAAFALGLWTGAVVVAALWLYHFDDADQLRPQVSPELSTQLSDQADQIRDLQRENARLVAETERLKQTAAELTSSLAAHTETSPAPRRIPFQRPTAATDAEAWMQDAVANGDKDALPRLEQAAQQNNEYALEALARLANRDAGAALTRIWNSGQLTFPNQVRAARYLGETLEVNPQADGLLRALFEDATTDTRLLYAAVDGIANPGPPSAPVLPVPLPVASPSETDFAMRVKLLDAVSAATADEQLGAHEEQARNELMSRWAEAEPPTQ